MHHYTALSPQLQQQVAECTSRAMEFVRIHLDDEDNGGEGVSENTTQDIVRMVQAQAAFFLSECENFVGWNLPGYMHRALHEYIWSLQM